MVSKQALGGDTAAKTYLNRFWITWHGEDVKTLKRKGPIKESKKYIFLLAFLGEIS